MLAPVQERPSFIGKAEGFGYLKRKHTVADPAEQRKDNFNLFDHGISESDICNEASRCLQCDLRLDISKPKVWGDFTESKEALR